ncbi:hypothetical protein Dsin_003335 [Dipteronia sinensis]|uniref:NAC domain-containing protein n=1 Tax=Dipteronia sinensis TaxID=43782 RepID=A0AAE0B9A8_9ROSI|nr:hypothetical protein Dsin_003335 [Dipteronia sinensis]
MGNPLLFQGIVVDCDLYGSKKPWEIWDEHSDKLFDCNQDLYVFTELKKIKPNGSRISRKLSTDSKGSWEGETKPKEVRGKLTGSVIGVLKKF